MSAIARERPLVIDYGAESFRGVSIPLFTLWRHQVDTGRGWVVRGLSFHDCTIEGPAVLMPVEACTFDGCDLGYNDGDVRNLILRPEGPRVTGAIPVAACIFTQCHFASIGFTGHESFLGQLQQIRGPGQ